MCSDLYNLSLLPKDLILDKYIHEPLKYIEIINYLISFFNIEYSHQNLLLAEKYFCKIPDVLTHDLSALDAHVNMAKGIIHTKQNKNKLKSHLDWIIDLYKQKLSESDLKSVLKIENAIESNDIFDLLYPDLVYCKKKYNSVRK